MQVKHKQETAIRLLMRLCRFSFGTFEIEEFKKFLRMGLILALILGIYWTLKSLKDSIFIQLVDKMHLPYAKTFSVFALFPMLMFYTRLLEKNSRERMLSLLPTLYGAAILVFSAAMFVTQASSEEIAARSVFPFLFTKILGYLWYVFVESFGSLILALFWAFATDTTKPSSAKRGFPLMVTMGQMGGVICPYAIGGLPHRLGFATDTFSLVILGLLTLSIVFPVRYFLRTTPSNLLVPFQEERVKKTKQKPDFLEGLRLLLAHRYLMGIFLLNFAHELIVTIFDFNFKLAASTAHTGVALSHYFSFYSSSVNIACLLCLLFGISNITRFLGLGVALAVMPIMMTIAWLGFLTIDSLPFLFALMVGLKAVNYALNAPSLKQLYIPTTKSVRFKAQAWIETFGFRVSKQAASLFNMSLKPLQSVFGMVGGRAYYLSLGGIIGFPLLVIWLVTVIYLARKFHKAVEENKVVC